jgi:hypothetical protein
MPSKKLFRLLQSIHRLRLRKSRPLRGTELTFTRPEASEFDELFWMMVTVTMTAANRLLPKPAGPTPLTSLPTTLQRHSQFRYDAP